MIPKRIVCALALLAVTTAALAEEPRRFQREARRDGPPLREPLRTGERRLDTPQKERDVAPFLYALPDLGETHGAVLELRITNTRRTLIRQTVALPAVVPAGATSDVLASHPTELQRVRAMAEARPGTIRLVASLGDRVLSDAFFDEIDEQSSSHSLASAVGTIREIDVKLVAAQRVRATEVDPACAEECELRYQECIDRCDPRGDSCGRCVDDYNWCYQICPDVCEEPKSVSTYTVRTVNNWAWYGNQACLSHWYPNNINARIWWEIYVWYTVRTYERTEHCDGSYTDVQIGQYNTSGWCWAEQSQSCNNPTDNPWNACN